MTPCMPRPTLPTKLLPLLLCLAAPTWAAPQPQANETPVLNVQAADPGARIDSDWVLRILARPAPMRTNFVEFRASRLLKEPLRLSGEYQRPDEATLVREVRAPYVETTTITSGKTAADPTGVGQATIARAGKPGRTFSLSRAPELAGLQASFGALLSGDRAMLEHYYRIDTEGVRRQWTMTLSPRSAQLADKVRDIKLYGQGIELRCIETRPVKGDVQRTLLASAARAAHDIAGADKLVALCHGDSSSPQNSAPQGTTPPGTAPKSTTSKSNALR